MKFNERFATHPSDFKAYATDRIRSEFLIEKIFVKDEMILEYSLYDRYIVGGAHPVSGPLKLESFYSLKSDTFLARREMGIINVGGKGRIIADGTEYDLDFKDALYLGMGTAKVTFESLDKGNPAKFYLNSAPAHHKFADKLVTLADAEIVELGSLESSNARKINKLIVNSIVETCQLQMGMTELQKGSVWNTMPVHTHNRRMEAYFYFDVPEGQAVCHFMGRPDETRHIWMKNEQAVFSPSWSIHSAAGTSNYIFIWGMAGENLDYGDMDVVQPDQIR